MLYEQDLLDGKNKKLLEFINPKKQDKILVIGTGVYPKIEQILFEKYGCKKIVSGDIEKVNIKNARKILPELKFVRLDAQKELEFKKNSFDKIIFTDVLEHLKNQRIILREISRILKSDGKLILSVPKKRWFNVFSPITWVQHEREYSEKRIKKVLEKNGFKIKKIFVGGSIFSLFNLWLHLFYKYFLRKLHPELFFRKQIDVSYKTGHRGKGTDIIILAKPFSD